MMHLHQAVRLAFVVTLLSSGIASGQSKFPLRFEGWPKQARLLPYQAVRFRLAITNSGNDNVGPISWLEDWAVGSFTTSGRTKKLYTPFEFRRSKLENFNLRPHLYLKTSESLTVSCAAAADWSDANGQLPHGSPLFSTPGNHCLKWEYLPGNGIQALSAELNVTVAVANGDDASLVEALAGDAEVRDAIMSPIAMADADSLLAMEEMLRQHPKSAYSSYLHFAIARAYLHGCFDDEKLRSKWETSVSSVLASESTDDELGKEIPTVFLGRRTSRGTEATRVRELVGGRHLEEAARRQAIVRFVDFLFVSTVDKQKSLIHLEQVTDPKFPYFSYAIVLQNTLRRDLSIKNLAEDGGGGLPVDLQDSLDVLRISLRQFENPFEWRQHRVSVSRILIQRREE